MNASPLPEWLAADPRLAVVFERIARALPGYDVPDGLTPYSLLESYAGLLETNQAVALLVSRRPMRDPEP